MSCLVFKADSSIAKLENSDYKADIPTMIERFEVSTKPAFKDNKEKTFIHFGSLCDNDPEVGIRRGQLILTGYVSNEWQLIIPTNSF